MQNYFNYFTEIEEHFQRRRGGPLIVSTLDWSLMELWKDAGIPLEAVLRGIDATFENYERRPSKTRKINALGFCAQEVLAAAEDMKEAAVGTSKEPKPDKGFDPAEIAAFFETKATSRLEDLERRLTVLEEKLFAVLLAAVPDDEVIEVRAQADRELNPYRRKMPSGQLEQLRKQFVHKRLLEKYGVPRLSLFYM